MRDRIDTEKVFDALSYLHAFSKAVHSTLDLREVEELIVEWTVRLMQAKKVLILLLDESKTTLTPHKFYGLDQKEMKVQTKRFHNLKAFDHYIVHKGTIITIDEVLKEEDLNRQREEMPFLSDMVFAPFETKGEVCGLLGISRDFPEFSNFELEMFCSVGSQAATALKNAHVYKKLYDAFIRTTESLVRIINSRASHIDGHA